MVRATVHFMTIIFYYRSTNTYALNVLAGAVQSRFSEDDVHVMLSSRIERLVSDVREALSRRTPVVVGWSFYTAQAGQAFRDLSKVRHSIRDPRVIHLAGGVHASAEPESTLRSGFDYVAVGEGEQVIVDFVRSLLEGVEVRKVIGISCLENGLLSNHGSAEPIVLDEFPPFAPEIPKVNPIEITRGCRFACSFCQTPFMFKARFRHRSVPRIVEYADFVLSQGAKDIRFITPSSLSYGSQNDQVCLERVEELLASVHSTLAGRGRIFFGTFPSEVRPEHVSPAALAILKKYVSNDNLLIGGQSGSGRMLDRLHRGHDVACIRDAVRYCREAGFKANVDFIFGLPGETDEDVDASLALADELTSMGARIHGHAFMPLPGTPLKNALAGEIGPRVQEKLHRLIASGKLYGQWKTQEKIAHDRTLSKTGKFVRHDLGLNDLGLYQEADGKNDDSLQGVPPS